MNEEWEDTTLGEVATFVNGFPFKPEHLSGTKLPVIRIKQLLDERNEVDYTDLEVPQKNIIDDGDLIFSWSGTLASRFWTRGKAALNQHLFRVTANAGSDLGWVHLALDHAVDELMTKTHGTTMKHVTKKVLESHKVVRPPFPVQRRIVDLMTHLDAHIANLQAEGESASKVLEALVSEHLFGNQSGNWPLVKLGEAFDVRDGTHESPKYVDVGFPLLTSKNLSSGRLSLEGAKLISLEDFNAINVRSEVSRGDLLLAMIGTIGNACLVESEPDFAVKNVAIFKSRTEASRRLLYYQLSSREVTEKMAGEAKGSTQKFVSLGYLRNFEIRLPTPSLAREIVQVLDLSRNIVQSLAEEAAAAALLRNLLLSSILAQQTGIPWENLMDAVEVA